MPDVVISGRFGSKCIGCT